MLHALLAIGVTKYSEAMVTEPVYEGETWVEKDSPFKIVCKIPMQEPYSMQWTIDNDPLDTSLVFKKFQLPL